jgi:hypothetical protein
MDTSTNLDCRNLKETAMSLTCVLWRPVSLIPEEPVIRLSVEDEKLEVFQGRAMRTISHMGLLSSFSLATY